MILLKQGIFANLVQYLTATLFSKCELFVELPGLVQSIFPMLCSLTEQGFGGIIDITDPSKAYMIVCHYSDLGALSVHTLSPSISTKVVGESKRDKISIAVFLILCCTLSLYTLKIVVDFGSVRHSS